MSGASGCDRLSGGTGADTLKGYDRLAGDADNDALIGGVGDDSLDGMPAEETPVFAGKIGDYEITTVGDVTTVIDLQPLATGNDGTDTLTTIERLQFADGLVPIVSGPGPDPIADAVIVLGDPLLGGHVEFFLCFSPLGGHIAPAMNDGGQIAFVVFLDDGREVLVRANPSAAANQSA